MPSPRSLRTNTCSILLPIYPPKVPPLPPRRAEIPHCTRTRMSWSVTRLFLSPSLSSGFVSPLVLPNRRPEPPKNAFVIPCPVRSASLFWKPNLRACISHTQQHTHFIHFNYSLHKSCWSGFKSFLLSGGLFSFRTSVYMFSSFLSEGLSLPVVVFGESINHIRLRWEV